MPSIRAAGRWLSALALAYAAYMSVTIAHGWLRGFADDVNEGRSYSLVAPSDLLFGGVIAQHLQTWFGTQHPFLVEASFQLWFSLFWMTPLLALAAFAIGGPRAFYRLLAVHAVLVFSADALYALVPTRPPWMDVELVRVVALQVDGLTSADTNPYAALPSLHVGVPVAYAVWFWRQSDPRLRACAPALALWAAAMAFAVVYAGEHYVFCVALGALMGVATNVLLERVHVGDLWPWSARAPADLAPALQAEATAAGG